MTKLTKEQRKLLDGDNAYVIAPEYDNNIWKVIEENPDGLKVEEVAQMFGVSRQAMDAFIKRTLKKVKVFLKEDGVTSLK